MFRHLDCFGCVIADWISRLILSWQQPATIPTSAELRHAYYYTICLGATLPASGGTPRPHHSAADSRVRIGEVPPGSSEDSRSGHSESRPSYLADDAQSRERSLKPHSRCSGNRSRSSTAIEAARPLTTTESYHTQSGLCAHRTSTDSVGISKLYDKHFCWKSPLRRL